PVRFIHVGRPPRCQLTAANRRIAIQLPLRKCNDYNELISQLGGITDTRVGFPDKNRAKHLTDDFAKRTLFKISRRCSRRLARLRGVPLASQVSSASTSSTRIPSKPARGLDREGP